jgi:hypothetical protein
MKRTADKLAGRSRPIRIQLDFDDEHIRRLSTVKELSESVTNVDAIRKALKVYEWLLRQRRDDARLLLIKGDQSREIEFIL